RRSVRFPINSPPPDACRPELPTTLIYPWTRCQTPRARYMEVHNGRLLSRPRVILRRPQISPVVYSDRSEDFSADDECEAIPRLLRIVSRKHRTLDVQSATRVQEKCRFINARPEPDFKYFSKAIAMFSCVKAK